MSEIKPNPDGTCSPDCPSYMDVTPGISSMPVCMVVPGRNIGTAPGVTCRPARESPEAVAIDLYEHVIDLLKVRGARYVSWSLLADARVKALDMVAEDLIQAVLELLVPGKVYQVGTKLIPVGWWDHLLCDHPWMRRLFGSPKFSRVTISTTHVCPHIDVSWSRDQGPHLRFLDDRSGAGRSRRIDPVRMQDDSANGWEQIP